MFEESKTAKNFQIGEKKSKVRRGIMELLPEMLSDEKKKLADVIYRLLFIDCIFNE